MTKKCFVPKCKSGYKTCREKVSLFRVPNNETLRQQWQNAIGREDRIISRKDHVCEKHFQEEDVVRYWIYQDIKDKLKTPRLKKNAVPSIFPSNCTPSEKMAAIIKPKSKTTKNKNKCRESNNNQVLYDDIIVIQKDKNNDLDIKQTLCDGMENYETCSSSSIESILATTKSIKASKNKNQNIDCDSNEQLCDNIADYQTLDNILKDSDLFNQLWDNQVVLAVPSPSWALHKVQNCHLKTIVVSDVEIISGVPCYQKQIIMNHDNTVSIIIGTNVISQQEQIKYFGSPVELHNLEDLNILINTLHLLGLTLDDINVENGFCEVLN